MTIRDVELFAEGTHSTSIVPNPIVGIRLNRAKRNGIAVLCHIHAPDRLAMDEADLNILLSNMLENFFFLRQDSATGYRQIPK